MIILTDSAADLTREDIEAHGIRVAPLTINFPERQVQGERYQVLAAALAVKANWGKKAILERLDRVRAATEVVFTLETLEYLRVSPVLGVHTGPGVVGAAVVPINVLEGLE